MYTCQIHVHARVNMDTDMCSFFNVSVRDVFICHMCHDVKLA
jgi:hypothetical protein